jgi:hypothetical protein
MLMNKLNQIIVTSIFTILCWLPAVHAEQGVDCSTAKADIAHLQHEKKSTDERIAKGVFAIMPIGLALNAVQSAGDSSSKNMDSKEYSKQIDSRIAEIKSECGV